MLRGMYSKSFNETGERGDIRMGARDRTIYLVYVRAITKMSINIELYFAKTLMTLIPLQSELSSLSVSGAGNVDANVESTSLL